MENAFTLLTTTQQFASGGWGPNETFITPHRGELHAALGTTVDHFETPCGAYAATKLARYLTRVTSDPRDTRYADNLERVLFNTILAVRAPDSDGEYPYYSTYSPRAEKVYYQKKWPCCSGTLVQTVADYPLNLYFQSDAGVHVAGYTPSRVRVSHGGVKVEMVQETSYPAEETSVLTVNPERAIGFALYLRVPEWAHGASIAINGKTQAGVQAGAWARVQRTWKAGDRVEIRLPQEWRLEAIDDRNPGTVALMRGPVQYVALNAGDAVAAPAGLKQIAPEAFVEGTTVFVPLYRVRAERYTTYFSRA